MAKEKPKRERRQRSFVALISAFIITVMKNLPYWIFLFSQQLLPTEKKIYDVSPLHKSKELCGSKEGLTYLL
jgi:hypothetical protein